jgi:HTH-type transcriptional regulator/antitoxin HigA
MNIKPIKTGDDYNLALKRLELIFDADVNTPESDELEFLVTLIENYENIHYPIDMPGEV